MRTQRLSVAFALSFLLTVPGAWAQVGPSPLDCGFDRAAAGMHDHLAAIQSGLHPDPRARMPAYVPPRQPTQYAGTAPTFTVDDVFPYEDTAGLLLTNFSTGDLIDLMTDAANALLVAHGDNFDFVGFWTNFVPDHLIGAAFYSGIENDVLGIGLGTFNSRPALGLAGDNVEGYVMMWNVNDPIWHGGEGPEADFTRLALGQEFEHRFALFLAPLLDGRVMQGDDAACGRSAHWNWQIDGQGSSMEICEWVGASPALLTQNFVSFNNDIPGSVFSYSDLYLMGYVSPAAMDAGNSELRFMETSNCSGLYSGTISSFDSSDIIASNGPRIPDSTAAQKDFRTGWIVLHQPGQPPTPGERTKLRRILGTHQKDWAYSTLGLGIMDDTLPDPVIYFGDLGGAAPGVNGLPALSVNGPLTPGTIVNVDLVDAAPSTTILLWVSDTSVPLPAFGGTLYANPFDAQLVRSTDPGGAFSESAPLPGLPSGTDLFLQFLVADGTVAGGVTLSNAVTATVP